MERAFGFAFRSSESRLAHFILTIKAPPASAVALPCHGKFDYSRREIAENLGLSPETVIRTLSSFQSRGLIRLNGKAIEIRNRALLENVAAER
jgi:CRP-like cAMP-binding protein